MDSCSETTLPLAKEFTVQVLSHLTADRLVPRVPRDIYGGALHRILGIMASNDPVLMVWRVVV
jgi:hypothetical protein